MSNFIKFKDGAITDSYLFLKTITVYSGRFIFMFQLDFPAGTSNYKHHLIEWFTQLEII